jgi:hypothetical protein
MLFQRKGSLVRGTVAAFAVVAVVGSGTVIWAAAPNDTMWKQITNTYPSNIYNRCTGNVGIGTTAPAAKLHVRDTTASAGQKIVFQGTTNYAGANAAIKLGDNSNSRAVLGYKTGDIAVDAQGWVGIGTTNPLVKLHVIDKIMAQANVSPSWSSVSAYNSDNDGIEMACYGRSSGSSGPFLGQTNLAGGVFLDAWPNNNVMGIGTRNGSPLIFGTMDAERIRIDAIGRVGIGTTSPDAAAKLDVAGKVKTSTFQMTNGSGTSGNVLTSDASGNALWSAPQWTTNGGDIYRLSGNVGIGGLPADALRKLWVQGIGESFVEQSGTHGITFIPNVNGNGIANTIFSDYFSGSSALPLTLGAWPITNALTLLPNGNVGIGTPTPSAALEVAGTGDIKCKSITINSNWVLEAPDYVFDKGYKLASLNDVEKQITAKKHLPEVPSAAEMKTKGLDIAQMNMTLLKKVEELTLYAIDQNKKMEVQNRKMESQTQKMEAQNQKIAALERKIDSRK